MKTLIAILLSTTCCYAQSTSDDSLKSIGENIKEIARQRDEAINQLSEVYQKHGNCKDFVVNKVDKTDEGITKITQLLVNKGIDTKIEINGVVLDDPQQTVCLLKIKDECALEYNGTSEGFVSRRPFALIISDNARRP